MSQYFKAIPVKERLPEYATIHWCLIGGILPIMAQYNPQGWCWLDSISATREPQVIGGKGVSHWLEPINNIMCSFCNEDGFDEIGLKEHLLIGRCEKFEHTNF